MIHVTAIRETTKLQNLNFSTAMQTNDIFKRKHNYIYYTKYKLIYDV